MATGRQPTLNKRRQEARTGIRFYHLATMVAKFFAESSRFRRLTGFKAAEGQITFTTAEQRIAHDDKVLARRHLSWYVIRRRWIGRRIRIGQRFNLSASSFDWQRYTYELSGSIATVDATAK